MPLDGVMSVRAGMSDFVENSDLRIEQRRKKNVGYRN